jgi:hypothetical protein
MLLLVTLSAPCSAASACTAINIEVLSPGMGR